MIVAVVKETYPGEKRVAMTPATIPSLTKAGIEVLVESGAGAAAGHSDEQYVEKGAKIAADRDALFRADAVVQVRSLGANLEAGRDDLKRMRPGQLIIGTGDPLGEPKAIAEIAETGATFFALELIPRITRAQSMDVLSSMATIAGYKAVLLAANHLPKVFPLLMTAAGTLTAAKVFVIGAGVAGLQAIATARRLGAIVHAYDVRPAVKEQIESLGAKFVEMELDTGKAEDKGGYAQAMDEDFYRRQRELMAQVLSESDVCVTTAAIPGRQSPLLITADAVKGMPDGSVIVDLAAERGGNCELSQADQTVIEHGVTILGPTNLPAELPTHASLMFAKNVATLLLHLTKDGQLELDREDEIVRGTLACCDGQVVHERLRDLLELPKLEPETKPETSEEPETSE